MKQVLSRRHAVYSGRRVEPKRAVLYRQGLKGAYGTHDLKLDR